MLPPAPGRFSITSGWPSVALTCGPMARRMASALPPGGKVTTTLIGLVGQASWARAGPCSASSAALPSAAHQARRVRMGFMGRLR